MEGERSEGCGCDERGVGTGSGTTTRQTRPAQRRRDGARQRADESLVFRVERAEWNRGTCSVQQRAPDRRRVPGLATADPMGRAAACAESRRPRLACAGPGSKGIFCRRWALDGGHTGAGADADADADADAERIFRSECGVVTIADSRSRQVRA